MGKTTAAHGLQDVTMRGIQRWGTETTISSPFIRQWAVTTEATTSFSLSRSLTVHTVTLNNKLTQLYTITTTIQHHT